MAFIRERTEELDQSSAAFARPSCLSGCLQSVVSRCVITLRRGTTGTVRPVRTVLCTDAKDHQHIAVTFSRSRHRTYLGSSSFVPVDDSLIDGYLTIPAAALIDHCTPRDAAELFEKLGGMNPSASHLRRLSMTAGELWKGKAALDEIRKVGPPAAAVLFRLTASWSRFAPTGTKKRAGAKHPAVQSVSMTGTAIVWTQYIFRGCRKPARSRRRSWKRSRASERRDPTSGSSPSPMPQSTTGRFSKGFNPTSRSSIFLGIIYLSTQSRLYSIKTDNKTPYIVFV